jgi:signal transduction histidine kinase
MSGRRFVKPSGRTVLVVDDQIETLESVRLLLEREGHRVLTAGSGMDALNLLSSDHAQLMLVDYFMPVMNGEDLIHHIRERDQIAQIVLQTGYAGEKPPREMLRRLAIQGYHDKSDGPERLLVWVDASLKAYDQLAQLHAAERAKTELLANVSHEFRTPLNVVVGYVELLREGAISPDESTAVYDKVLMNTKYLIDLVEEFLNCSKIEAGAMQVTRETVDLTPFLRERAEAWTLLIRTKPVQFQSDIPDNLPLVAAEPAKLRMVVENLLTNAGKFTERGHIRLSAASLPDGRVAIRVSDSGPGIAPENHERIFEIFQQLQPHDGTKSGVGLGLALARRLARMMEGDITLESSLGQGTIFTLTLPAATTTQEAAA